MARIMLTPMSGQMTAPVIKCNSGQLHLCPALYIREAKEKVGISVPSTPVKTRKMNKGFVSVLAALALLGCVSGQAFNFQAFTPGSLATLALLPPLINQLSLPVRPPPPPPPFLFGGYQPGFLPPTIIERRVRYHPDLITTRKMNKGFVSVLAALALLGCVSGQAFNFQAFTPGSLATLALLPPLINQLSLPVRPPPPPPPFLFGGYQPGFLPPTINTSGTSFADKGVNKNVLIVFAHQDRASFNGKLLDVATHVLEGQGHTVQISDLYAQDFDPVAKKCDISGNLADKRINTSGGKNCYSDGEISPHVRSEMDKLKAADLVIFQFPMFWSSTPAILKGWFDRVLQDGFAFNFETKQILDNGLMAGKKALLSITTGGTRSMLSDHGVSGDINVLLWPLQYGILRICGFEVLPPQLSHGLPFINEATRADYLSQWQERLREIWTEVPMSFPTCSDYDSSTLTFIDDFTDKTKQSKCAPSIGHHLDKPLPRQTQGKSPKVKTKL
ncbi:NAD(P)H dehydrogenase [quinone] 1-like [Ylistrum balloti]|uniref:NAD(P)H dehydrogenase [quinone] 1-like n=1 Tax=Ylistrum balloti TaxID=509963 RepID=UPI002905811C|nr:NAD(P)H dehydrogenase [quinone] 1-like [Ylistrum balloti]